METETFCGQSCHVMAPEFRAHQVSPHSKVACVDCHVGPGAGGWLHAKMNGTRQLIEAVLNSYPRPIPSAIRIQSSRNIDKHMRELPRHEPGGWTEAAHSDQLQR